MSETFTGKQGTVFHVVNDEFIRTERPAVCGTISFDLPLTDLLEFADSIERRETDKPDISLKQQSDAWSAVWDKCVELGMLEMKAADAQSGQERVVAFIAQLADRAQQAEAPLTERTKLLAMMAAAMCGRETTLAGQCFPNDAVAAAEAILEAIEKEAK